MRSAACAKDLVLTIGLPLASGLDMRQTRGRCDPFPHPALRITLHVSRFTPAAPFLLSDTFLTRFRPRSGYQRPFLIRSEEQSRGLRECALAGESVCPAGPASDALLGAALPGRA